uniref:Uncharacterized protein n=1 Tax=Anguilla anguilla TaxID=7936 RepID=A0A0E9R0D0_ANGAN
MSNQRALDPLGNNDIIVE